MQNPLNLVRARMIEVQDILESSGYPRINIEIKVVDDLPPKTSGTCSFGGSLIKISEAYLKMHEEEVLRTTVPHEVCHSYVNKYFPRAKQHHGPEWRSLMRLLGLRGDTYHTMEVPEPVRKNKKVRFVYKTDSGILVRLTHAKHKMAYGGTTFIATSSKERFGRMHYTGKVEYIY